jgi:hypothetical protein
MDPTLENSKRSARETPKTHPPHSTPNPDWTTGRRCLFLPVRAPLAASVVVAMKCE